MVACCLHCQKYLVFKAVDTVDDIIVLSESEVVFGSLVEEFWHGSYFGIGSYIEESLPEGIHLVFAYGRVRRHRLTVDVALCHLVVIDDGEPLHPAADKALGTPTAYAAYTEDDYFFPCKPLHNLVADKQPATLRVCICHCELFG